MNKFNIFLSILLVLSFSFNYAVGECTNYAGDGTVSDNIFKGYKTYHGGTVCTSTLYNPDGTTAYTVRRSVTIGEESEVDSSDGSHIEVTWVVGRDDDAGSAYFIPTKSLLEWMYFKDNKPSLLRAYELTINDACTPTSHDECASSSSWVWVQH